MIMSGEGRLHVRPLTQVMARRIDIRCLRLSCAILMRLILAILVALSLAASPSPAFTAPSADCSMPGAAEGMAPDHEEMPCCTSDCAVSACAAVLPDGDTGQASGAFKSGPVAAGAAGVLPAINPAALDPPPRA